MSSASTGGTEGSSPASSPASAASLAMAAPKYGTLVPNRIFVGGISANTSEAELAQLFSAYGNVKATKIIADRAGVSKGYGFVTFETEEEAKRLQQESECIVLRERKLNIAPAIKKQPFNRSFDGGSGSPPAVPTSTYYYTNGMGLTYQNGMTFYNTGALAPGTPLAPPADPASIYQATGVFGPQATAGHQTFAPVMYPCPAPSLYMPQQYQYSPMPYEPYYAGAAAAGAPQYMYATSNSQSNTSSGSGNGSGNGNNSTGATSSPTGPPPPLPTLPPPPPTHHFYAPAPPPSHHHPPVPTGPPPPQVDHLYYSFTAGPPPPPPPHAPIGLADQQLLLYTTDAPCQPPPTSDNQAAPQEDSRSTSSHSEQPHGETQAVQPPGSATPLVPLMPIKFPMSGRYTNYHPIAIHATNLHNSQTCLSDTDDCNASQMHCRTIMYHPATIYIPHTHTSPFHTTSGGTSLLPTPPSSMQQTLESNVKMQNFTPRDYSKTMTTNTQNNYAKSQNLSIALISGVHQNNYSKGQSINSQTHKYGSVDTTHKYPASTMSARLSVQQYNKRTIGSNVGSPSCFLSQKSGSYVTSGQNAQKSGNFGTNANYNGQTYSSACSNAQKAGIVNATCQGYDYANGRRNANYVTDQYFDGANKCNKSTNYGTGQKNVANNYKCTNSVSNVHIDGLNNNQGSDNNYSSSQADSQTVVNAASQGLTCTETIVPDKSASPPPAPYSPMTRPLPILSPPTPQVQFYASTQSRYQPPLPPSQHQQQPAQRRYTVAPPLPTGRKPSEKYSSANAQNSMLRQTKYKVNGIMQTGGKVSEDNLGGAGDAPPGVGRMPITPPGTPRTHPGHSTSEQNQLSDACHQMQALSL